MAEMTSIINMAVSSSSRMYRCCSFPRRDGQAPFEGDGRLGSSCLPCTSEPAQSPLESAVLTHPRNTISTTHSPLRRASGIPTSSTTLLGATTPRSTLDHRSAVEPKSCQLRKRYRNYSLEDVHVEGAERIAEAVAKYDVDRFIHVSSYNANPASPSEFFATKVGRQHGANLQSSPPLIC
jgi:hypothetical protein